MQNLRGFNVIELSVLVVLVQLATIPSTKGCAQSRVADSNKPATIVVRFPSSPIVFDVPTEWVTSTDNKGLISIAQEPDCGCTLYISLLDDTKKIGPDFANRFLENQAKKKQQKIKQLGKNLAISETLTRLNNGHELEMTDWQIVVADYFVAATIETEATKKSTSIVSDSKKRIKAVLESIRIEPISK